MSTRTAALAVDVSADVSRAVGGLDDVGSAARSAGDGVAQMGRDAEDSARRLNVTADSADELGGKAGKATGALGALSSGFELLGPSGSAAAAGLQSAALATDFLSGVGDSLNLVMESTIVKTGLAKVAMVGHAIASGASAAATGVMTAAQWALNAAMNANPIGLIVLAIAAVAAGMILAYQKSETFRNIVQGVGRAGAEAVGWVVDKVDELVGWLDDNLPGGLNTAKRAAQLAFDVMTLGPRTLLDLVNAGVTAVGKLPGAFEVAKDKAVRIADAITAPFRDLANFVQSILDKIAKIKLPDVNPFNGRVAPAGGVSAPSLTNIGDFSTTTTTTIGPTYNYTFNLNGLLTDDEAADLINELLDRRARQLGLAA